MLHSSVLLLILVASFFFFWRGACHQQQCYSQAHSPFYFHFATKTSYLQLSKFLWPPSASSSSRLTSRLSGCEPKSLWLLSRHGSRYPGDNATQRMLKLAPDLRDAIVRNHQQEGRGELCAQDVEGLKKWTSPFSADLANLLTPSGKEEHLRLGQRFRSLLPSLMDLPYDRESFKVRHTKRRRTAESAAAFVKGAFPEDQVHFDPVLSNDTVLRFYDFCPKWSQTVDVNKETYEEQSLFRQSERFQHLLSRLNSRLGFRQSDEAEDLLKTQHVFVLYDLCRFETVLYPEEKSVWCAAFSPEDLEVMEYHEDLEYWSKNGYFQTINRAMACPLLKDMVAQFDRVLGVDSQLKGTFYFSHSEAVLPFLTLMGLYRDSQPPTHSNFESMKNRSFRTSLISPFSTNVGFVLVKCHDGPKVMMLHQEQVVLPGRCSSELCDWSHFKNEYRAEIECDLETVCRYGSQPTAASKAHSTVALFMLALALPHMANVLTHFY